MFVGNHNTRQNNYGRNERTVLTMGISLSLILAAAGAVLAWAVNAEVSGIELRTIGFILLVVGIVGILLSVVFWSSFGGFAAGDRSRGTVVRERELL
jgi:Domain of unknown function (DUF6458)